MTYIGASHTSTGADPAVNDFVAMAHTLLNPNSHDETPKNKCQLCLLYY